MGDQQHTSRLTGRMRRRFGALSAGLGVAALTLVLGSPPADAQRSDAGDWIAT